ANLPSHWNITKIGNGMLAGSFLQSISIPETWRISEIGDSFLARSKVLNGVDLSAQTELTKIGNDFLTGDASCTLPATWKVTSIGDNFLWGIGPDGSTEYQIMTITLPQYNGPAGQTITIGEGFIGNVIALQQLTIPSSWNVESIGSGFLTLCKELISVDMGSVLAIQMAADRTESTIYKYYSFAGKTYDSPAYTTGVTISDNDKSNIVTKFPTGTSGGVYRKTQAAS
ncbi:MAG: leucine-rich repeat protein, partial [Malacoplasma sp.]|nr:leucine-rich repeat protein [Malacoplasma sp.]